MSMHLRNTIAALLLVFACAHPLTIFAGTVIDITTTPTAPTPFAKVTVNLKSFAVDLGDAKIVWLDNKEIKQEGVGLTAYSFTAGDYGAEHLIEAFITLSDKTEFKETVTVRPATVDILWEADTTVPPFYKGKALPSESSMIRFFALPQFGKSQGDPRPYQYKWTANRSQGLTSGIGAISASVFARAPGTGISVIASSVGGGYIAERMMNIPSAAPKIVFYEETPLFGMKTSRALMKEVRASGEMKVVGFPYFFYAPDMEAGNLLRTWLVNSADLGPTFAGERSITVIRGSGDGVGEIVHTVTLDVVNALRVLQSARNSISINFGE